MKLVNQLDMSFAQQLDEADELSGYRERFIIDDPHLIYVDGNSLGRLPAATAELMKQVVVKEWGHSLIDGWNVGWYDLPERLGAKLSLMLGAQSDEVILADSTSVNLFKLALAALAFQQGRTKIVTDDMNFPSDLYILQSVAALAGPEYELVVVPAQDGLMGNIAALESTVDPSTALLTLSHTAFKSSFTYDMSAITEIAHRNGALVLWDTSHSVGAIPIDLHHANADLAIGCTYKYLNGGPGSPAFIYVRKDLQDKLLNPVSGWMGQHNPFNFDLTYSPAEGIRRFLSGTPPILSLAAAEPGIDLILEAGIARLRAKSIQQTEYFIHLWKSELSNLSFVLRSPRDPAQRGSHVSLGHPEGWRISQALIKEKMIIPDFRTPDNIRVGFAPLYNSFQDVKQAADGLRDVVRNRLYERYESAKPVVT